MSCRTSNRNGFSFAELIIALALITLLFGLVTQINVTISNAVRRNELHLAASEELDNIIEQFAAISYDDISSGTSNDIGLIRSQNRVAKWTLSVTATETKDDIATKRIEVALTSPQTQPMRVQRVFWKSSPLVDAVQEDGE